MMDFLQFHHILSQDKNMALKKQRSERMITCSIKNPNSDQVKIENVI